MVKILIYLPVLIASVIVGRWFLSEVAKSKQKREPWYKPYLSIPGIIIIIGLMAPVVIYVLTR